MANIVTIGGDRQVGKTHAALAVAAIDAVGGRTVVWFAHGWHQATDAQLGILDLLPESLVHRSRRANGASAVEMVGGGCVRFGIPRHWSHHAADTFIFDETPVPDGFPALYPGARVYVTELTGADPGPARLAERLLEAARDYAQAVQ